MSIPKKQPKIEALDGLPDFPEVPGPLRRNKMFNDWNDEIMAWWDVVRERIYTDKKTVSE